MLTVCVCVCVFLPQEHGVDYTTFDTISELHKIAAQHPGFKCVLRIRADDPDARVPLGLKYGADMADGPELLRTAKQLGLNVVGVSFHVGSACQNLAAFSDAIRNARQVRWALAHCLVRLISRMSSVGRQVRSLVCME